MSRRLLGVALPALWTYLVVELVFSALYVHGAIARPPLYVFEDSGRTVHFDPVLGYRLTPVPSRFARLDGRRPEYVGTLRGNDAGFADPEEIAPQGSGTRLAVLGDSFTAASFLERSWPSAVEAKARAEDCGLDLLNLALDGAGLANWWSVVARLLDAEGFALDGVVFAVYEDDLWRGFTVAEHRGRERPGLARMRSWDPDDWPRDAAAARAVLEPLPAWIVDRARFEQAIAGRWHPELPRPWRPWGARTVAAAAAHLGRGFRPPPSPWQEDTAPTRDEAGRRALIADLAARLHRRGVPVVAVEVPSRTNLELGGFPSPEVRAFADALGADHLDGGAAFADLAPAEMRAHFFRRDGHWNQRGSDRFAAWLWRQRGAVWCPP